MPRPCTCESCIQGPYTADQCRLCWLYHNHKQYHDLWDSDGSSKHDVDAQFTMTQERHQSFLKWIDGAVIKGARALRAYKRWWKAGCPRPTPEQIAQRVEACSSCPHLVTENDGSRKCGLCGCSIDKVSYLVGVERPGKAEMATEVCPDNPPRWKSLL